MIPHLTQNIKNIASNVWLFYTITLHLHLQQRMPTALNYKLHHIRMFIYSLLKRKKPIDYTLL